MHRLFIILVFLLSKVGFASELSELIPNRLYTGPEPQSSTWEKLKKMEIKTVISVDGIRPDTETAEKNGINYIHLPIGYDGINEERHQQLASALKHSEGPIFLHCHHGKHRGPAAAAIAALSNGEISQEKALSYLEAQKTSHDYEGLWDAVRKAKPLQDVPKVEFASYIQPGDLADAMAKLDRSWERVQMFRKQNWSETLKHHPDLVLQNELLMILEYLKESERLGEPSDELTESEAKELKSSYQKSTKAFEQFHLLSQQKASEPTALEEAYQSVRSSCKSCHANFRN